MHNAYVGNVCKRSRPHTHDCVRGQNCAGLWVRVPVSLLNRYRTRACTRAHTHKHPHLNMLQVLLMMAWSHRGLREMELLALIDSLNQTQLRRYKEMLLDELLLPLFGVYDFITPSLKMALRR